jgi:hypothetical protein
MDVGAALLSAQLQERVDTRQSLTSKGCQAVFARYRPGNQQLVDRNLT